MGVCCVTAIQVRLDALKVNYGQRTFSNGFDSIIFYQTSHFLARSALPCLCSLELLQRTREKLPGRDHQIKLVLRSKTYFEILLRN
jgi:hypothetical protein